MPVDETQATIRECVKQLEQSEMQLAYLALLTRQGVKPLSRWEKPVTAAQLSLMQTMGLHTASVVRTVQSGHEVVETLFSTLQPYCDLYLERFDRTPIDKTLETVRLEGYLFGYPPCCVEAFFQQPYARNGLSKEDQQILFHWACSECRITPYGYPVTGTGMVFCWNGRFRVEVPTLPDVII